jgi:hypothetical protein
VSAFPLNLSYYTPPSLDVELPPNPEPNPLLKYPRDGANKRSPGVDLTIIDQTQPPQTIDLIRVELLVSPRDE